MRRTSASPLWRATTTVAFMLCLAAVRVGGQSLTDVQNVVDEIMAILCFTPCGEGFSGNEVIPGTKCQW